MTTLHLPLAAIHRVILALPEGGIVFLAQTLALLLSRGVGNRRRVMLENLRTVFGDELSAAQQEEILYQSWKNLLLTGFETLRFPKHGQRYLAELKTNHFEILEASMREGRGMILLAPHSGNFFLGASFLAQSFPVSVLIRPSRDRAFQAMMQRSYASMGFETIDRVGGMRHAVRALRQGRMLVIAFDQHGGGSGLWVPFFGRPASTYTTPAALALKYGAPVHIGHLHRYPDGRNEAWGIPAFELIRTGDPQEDIFLNTLQFNKKFEELIRQRPQTWMWMHKRWKEPPADISPSA
ncbi:MAG: hypothetical protein RBU29_00935 [bacterium]|jgi:KDO2-lipid IV(A) lauroyltransferase|nr:hypothetical protein [bacterium]